MACAVRRGMSRRANEPVGNLGVDEKSFKKRHKYLTVVNDLDGSRVLYVAPGRGQASLDGFWPTLTKEQHEAIRSVSIDMWDPFPCGGTPWEGGGHGSAAREQGTSPSR